MEYRIEATHPAVMHSVRQRGHHTVNGLKFELKGGRVISEPASDQQIKTFQGVSGYLLVRAEDPYDRVSDLSGEKIVLREKEPTPEEPQQEAAAPAAAAETAAEEPAAAAPEEAAASEAPAEPPDEKPKRRTRKTKK